MKRLKWWFLVVGVFYLLLAAALALAGVLPTLGWVVAGLAVLGATVGALVMHDWPPFMSYVTLLVLSIGLIRSG